MSPKIGFKSPSKASIDATASGFAAFSALMVRAVRRLRGKA